MIQRTPHRGHRRGIAAVELALLLPFLLMLLLGTWEVGRMLQIQQSLTNAAREGGRQASTGLLTNSQVEQVEDFRWISLYLVTTPTTRLNAQTVWYSYKDQDFPNSPNPLPGH
jgi:Flp pilus assembly protein TadG